MLEKRFNHLEIPLISQYEDYLPSAFSSELTLLQKVNKIIQGLIDTNKLTNEMVTYLNQFLDEVYEALTQQNKDITALRLELMQKIADLHEWLENEGIENHLLKLLEEMEETGRFEELILKATQVFGDIANFRQWDKLIIDKVKNEFIERGGVNVKEFGVKADGVTDDTIALQSAFDSGVDLTFPDATILISDVIKITSSDFTHTFYNTIFKTNNVIDCMFKIGAENAPEFTGNIYFNGRFTLDGGMKASHGLKITNSNVSSIESVAVLNCVDRGVYIYRDPENESDWVSICSATIKELYVGLSDFDWQNHIGMNNIGLEIETDDCKISNISMVHVTKAIVNKGENDYDKVHCWVINKYQMKHSVFFELYNSCGVTNAFSDTYQTSFLIQKPIGLNLTNFRSFFNQKYYTLNDIVDDVLDLPVMFSFVNYEASLSWITAVNSNFYGCIDGGGYLFNVDYYLPNMNFSSCVFSNLKQDVLSNSKREEMNSLWELGTLKEKNASTFTPPNSQIASVTLKPFILIPEEINGNLLPDGGFWYSKIDPSTMSYANNILTVEGYGSISFGGAYEQIDYETYLFIRFRFKCEKQCILKVVNRETGISVTNDIVIYQKEGWHDEYYIFKLHQELEPIDVEFLIDIDPEQNNEEQLNKIEITEVSLLDVYKRKIGYMFETTQDLANRLSKVGFISKPRELPLPKKQDFIIKSFPKNYGCRVVQDESNTAYEYTAYRSLQGLHIYGKEGNSPHKSFPRSFGLTTDARKRGLLYHYCNTLVTYNQTVEDFPSSSVFSDDIYYDGEIWGGIHYWYKDKVQPIPVSREDSDLWFLKLLTVDNTTAGNECVIQEEFLSPVSEPKVFSTGYMNRDSGYERLPIYKDGTVVVHSGGDGFADVEILWGE